MIYNGKEVEFPAIMQISFYALIERLEEVVNDPEPAIASYAKELLEEVEQYPALRDGITDLSELAKYQSSIDKMSRPLFPEVLSSNEIKMLTPPFFFEPIKKSARFEKIIEASGEPFSFNIKDVDEDTFYLYCCYFIMGSYYGYPMTLGTPQFIEIFNKNQGFNRVYKMLINADMSEFVPTEHAKKITYEDYQQLMDNFDDIGLWKEKFPPNSWIMRGLNMVNLVDVTQDQSVGSITSNLLVKSNDSFGKVQAGVRRLLNNNNLEIGVLTQDSGSLLAMDKEEVQSILLDRGEWLEMCEFTYDLLIDKREPLIVSSPSVFENMEASGMSQKILDSSFKSYMIIPLVYEEELLGFIELGSHKEYELHEGTLTVLGEVIPILSMAMKRFMTEAQNMIEAIIQQECTTIHPSVKWRFEEEAHRFMQQQLKGEQPTFRDIVFQDLYPLYGQMDIKGSSERRNQAVSADLSKQINGVKKVLKQAYKKTAMPIYEELIFRLDTFKAEMQHELAAGSEHKLLSFLREEIDPVFDHISKSDSELRKLVARYREMLDPELRTIYEERKKYDTSVNVINQRLASYMDQKQVEAQQMFPHYFERYKTDGVEYNMYIGQSISRDREFDPVYLKNLRVWQLVVMCELENEFSSLRTELGTTIEVASLILVYSTPIAVHFRMDEKQFDVEGAYNARYEIIKKRVDKAHIKGTTERITQPGSIAIVYSQEQDAKEYRTYLNFLQTKGYLKDEIEDVALEDLQGVHGLRALRVAVNYDGNLTVDEIIKEIEVSEV